MASQNANPLTVEAGQTVTTHFENAFAERSNPDRSLYSWGVTDTRFEEDGDQIVLIAELEYDDGTEIRAVFDFAENRWDIERPREGEWFRWNVAGECDVIPGDLE